MELRLLRFSKNKKEVTFFLLIVFFTIVNALCQEPSHEQVWPTIFDPARYDYFYQSHPWLAINPFNSQIIYVYASGKLLKSINGGYNWKEIGKGLLERASFPGIENGYATRLTFSPFDPSGNTLLLGTNREGVSGAPFLSTDGGEIWQPINICEKGPGLKNLTYRFTDGTNGIFSNKEENYIYLTSNGQVGAQPVFLGNLNYKTKKMSIYENTMFPLRLNSCFATTLQLKCPNKGNQQGCWQYSDRPWYWGGDLRLTLLPDSNDYFETDDHGLINDCDYPACHTTTKMKIFDPDDKFHCLVDNVYFDTSFFKDLCTLKHKSHQSKWHFLSPVYYSQEGLTFYSVLTKVQEYGDNYNEPLERCHLPYSVLAKCDGSDENNEWVFKVVANGRLPYGYNGPSRQIKKRGDWLFVLSATPSYNQGTLLSYNVATKKWIVFDGVVTFDFEVVDLSEGNIGIYYINFYKDKQGVYHTELKMISFNPFKAQWTNQVVYDFTALFTGLTSFRVFNDGYLYSDQRELIYENYCQKIGNRNLEILNDNFAFFYSGSTFITLRRNDKRDFVYKNYCWIEEGYLNSNFKLCTSNFTSTAIKSVGDEIWGYLSSDAGIWRNKKLNAKASSPQELTSSFEHISGGYGTTLEGQIPSDDFGNYCYKVVLDKRDFSERTLYSACKSGLWKGIENESGGKVRWRRVLEPKDNQFPDGGVKNVLINDCFIFAVTKEGIWRSNNDVDWDLIYDANLYGGPVTAISSFEDSPDEIAWAVGSNLYEESIEGKIYLSENEGSNFYAITTLSKEETPINLIQCVTNSWCHSIFFLDNQGILKRIQLKSQSLPISIINQNLPPVISQLDYNQNISAIGGEEPYYFWIESGELPEGLILKSDGTIFGNTDKAGNFPFKIRVVDSNCNEGAFDCLIKVVCPR